MGLANWSMHLKTTLLLLFSFFGLLYAQALTPAEIQDILDVHNAERCTFGIPALQWHDDLAACAQTHSELCAFQHSTSDYRKGCANVGTSGSPAGPWSWVGENIAAGTAGFYGPRSLTILWIGGERDDYFSAGSCTGATYASPYGHYTQAIWANTQYVGCGWKTCTNSVGAFLVCQYGFGGNFNYNTPIAVVTGQGGNANARCAAGQDWYATKTYPDGVPQCTGICGDSILNSQEQCDDGNNAIETCTPGAGVDTCDVCGLNCKTATNWYPSGSVAVDLVMPAAREAKQTLMQTPVTFTGCVAMGGTLEVNIPAKVPSGNYQVIVSSGQCLSGSFSSVTFNPTYASADCDVITLVQEDQTTNPNEYWLEIDVQSDKSCTQKVERQQSGGNLSGGAIAGIIIAVLVILAAAAVIVFFLLKKKKQNSTYKPQPNLAYTGSVDATAATPTPTPQPVAYQPPLPPKPVAEPAHHMMPPAPAARLPPLPPAPVAHHPQPAAHALPPLPPAPTHHQPQPAYHPQPAAHALPPLPPAPVAHHPQPAAHALPPLPPVPGASASVSMEMRASRVARPKSVAPGAIPAMRPVPPVPPKKKKMGTVEYDFEATTESEITCTAGQTVEIVDDSDAEWLIVKNGSLQGAIPKSYVTV